MKEDRELLARYVSEVSEDAFAELVQRHIGIVYSAALRQVRDPQLAQDVTQLVFANLARKAGSIPRGVVLAGWLHRDTRYTALDLLRAEARRFRREQEAAAMNALETGVSPDWEQIRPLLDEALDELPTTDRDALLLRFIEQRDFAAVGQALGASAEAARKRVDRALGRLRDRLVKRGIGTTAVALSGALAAHAVESIPAGFAATLPGSAMAAAASVTGGSLGWLSHVMVMTKTKTAIAAAVVAAGLGTPLFLQQQALGKARAEQVELQQRMRNLAARAAPVSAGVAQADVDAQRDRIDLERLRREAADLRAQISQLTAQENNLLSERASARKSTDGSKQISLAEARNVGHASPDGLVETFIWALSNGDTNLVFQLVASDAEPDVGKIASRAFAQLKQQLVGTVSSYGCTGFLVQGDGPVETAPFEDRWLTVDLMNTNGAVGQPSLFRVRRAADGWKLVITSDGMPVTKSY